MKKAFINLEKVGIVKFDRHYMIMTSITLFLTTNERE